LQSDLPWNEGEPAGPVPHHSNAATLVILLAGEVLMQVRVRFEEEQQQG
jgi:hypothetical protein